MSDLIDRTALIADIDKLLPVDPLRDDYTQGRTTGLALAMERIKNAPSVLGTNLAEVGTDLISREQAIDALYSVDEYNSRSVKAIKQLPPIQPEIIRCKDCKHYRHGLCMKASMCVNKSENGFCDWAERRDDG